MSLFVDTAVANKCRILEVVYNASNNELVRTNTLVKGCIVQIDSSPFKTFLEGKQHVKMVGKKGDVELNDEVRLCVSSVLVALLRLFCC